MGLVSVCRSAVDVRKGGLRDRGDPRQIRYRSQGVMSSGRVISLHIRGVKHAAPTRVGEAVGRVGGGIEGDAHADRDSRAVLVVDRATLDALRLSPGDLREEITIEGLPDVTNLPIDTELRIGGGTPRGNGAREPCTHLRELLGVPAPEGIRQSPPGRRGALRTVAGASPPRPGRGPGRG